MSNPKPSNREEIIVREDEEPVEDEPETVQVSSEEAPARRTPGLRTAAVCAGAAIATVGLAALCASAVLGPAGDRSPGGEQAPPAWSQQPEPSAADHDAEECEHVWIPVYGIDHKDAVTSSHEVDPTYESRTTAHTVCNDCLAIIDGKAQQHLDETGHSGYTPDVSVTDEVMTDEGGIVTVVVEDEADELVITGEKCALCEEERVLPSTETGE